MYIKNNIIKMAMLVLAFALSLNAQAGSFFKKTGIISAVDLENDTFSVTTASGAVEVYNFPAKINIIVNGSTLHDKALIVPGQAVTMKFSKHVSDAATPADTSELTIAGTVIELDRAARNGILRQDRTNNTVPFRFAEEFNSQMPKVGDKVVFTYKLDSIRIGMN